MKPLYILDLFSGIGGFSLGFEMADKKVFKTKAFCEIEPFCQKVLRKHWKDIPIFEDIKDLTYERLYSKGIHRVDIVTGGFPCQDLSVAGNRKGLLGERSGLFYEILRLLEETKPKYVLLENSSELIRRDDNRQTFVKELQDVGYGMLWHILQAANFGYLHKRERAYIFAWNEKAFTNAFEVGRICNETIYNSSADEKPKRPSKEVISVCREYNTRFAKQDFECDSRDIRRDDGISFVVDAIGALGNAVIPQIISVFARGIKEVERYNE